MSTRHYKNDRKKGHYRFIKVITGESNNHTQKRVVLLKFRSLGEGPAEFGPRDLQMEPCVAGDGATRTWRKDHVDPGLRLVGSDMAEVALRDCF